jgi:uncharacterized membrane protein YczE
VLGLGLFGLGIALLVEAHLGVAPWDVFHQGVSERTGIPMGTVIILTGLLVLLLFVPLRQRVGIGTVLNTLEIGLVVDLVLPVLPTPDHLAVRAAFLAGGLLVIGLGSAIYIGSGLGAGPRDGVMMGLAARGASIRRARTLVEVTVLLIGFVLGGSVGIGTFAFAFGIGPIVQAFLPAFMLPPPDRPAPVGVPAPRPASRGG